MASEPNKPKLESVTLTGPHTHKNEPKKKGDTIRVTSTEKDWLIAQGLVDGDPKSAGAAAGDGDQGGTK